MGTCATIMRFRNEDDRSRFHDFFASLSGRTETYKARVESNIAGQKVFFDLKFRVKPTLSVQPPSPILNIELDTEEPVENLDGTWVIKVKRSITLYFYKDPELADTVLCFTERYKDARAFFKVLEIIGPKEKLPRPLQIRITFLRTRDFIDKLTKLGRIGWIVISNIPDDSLRGTSMWGEGLEKSEVVTDLIRRGGSVKTVVLVNREKSLRILVSDRGSIYTPRNLNPLELAGELKELIKFFYMSKLFTFE